MDNQRSDGFHCRKWTLFTTSLLGIIITISIVALICIGMVAINSVIDGQQKTTVPKASDGNWTSLTTTIDPLFAPLNDFKTKEGVKTLSNIFFIIAVAIGLISVCIELIGLFGAFKEHFVLTLIYAIVLCLRCIYLFFSSFSFSLYWLSFAYNLFVCVIALLFVRDLSRLRNLQPTATVFMTTQPPMATYTTKAYLPSEVMPTQGWK